MAEPKRVQLQRAAVFVFGRLSVFALCFGLLSCLLVPFVVPVLALLEPSGTDVSNAAIKDSALLPIALWSFGWPIALARQQGELRLQLFWTLGCVLLLFHIAVAFHLGHGWSHAAAWEHTRQVGGYGNGIFVNYAFALAWLADVVWLWVSPRSYFTRPRWLNWTVHGFLAFVVFNAAVVFGSWGSRLQFVTFFFGTVLVVWWLRRKAAPSATTTVDQK